MKNGTSVWPGNEPARRFDYPLKYHLAGWLIFILYEQLFYFFVSGKWLSFTHSLVFYCINVGLCYVHI